MAILYWTKPVSYRRPVPAKLLSTRTSFRRPTSQTNSPFPPKSKYRGAISSRRLRRAAAYALEDYLLCEDDIWRIIPRVVCQGSSLLTEVRGLSSLLILRDIMEDIERGTEADETPKPCEYFYLIGGTGTGGLIAIILGLIGMVTSIKSQTNADCWRMHRSIYAVVKRDIQGRPWACCENPCGR